MERSRNEDAGMFLFTGASRLLWIVGSAMETDDMTESVARALWKRYGHRVPYLSEEENAERGWTAHKGHADAAITAHLSALTTAGYVVVPREPAAAMHNAALAAVDTIQTRADLETAYTAMIDAAHSTKGQMK